MKIKHNKKPENLCHKKKNTFRNKRKTLQLKIYTLVCHDFGICWMLGWMARNNKYYRRPGSTKYFDRNKT